MGREEEAIMEFPELPTYYQAWFLSLVSIFCAALFSNWNSLLVDLTCSTTPHCLHLEIPFFVVVVLTATPFPL